jgi:hypothetical protein
MALPVSCVKNSDDTGLVKVNVGSVEWVQPPPLLVMTVCLPTRVPRIADDTPRGDVYAFFPMRVTMTNNMPAPCPPTLFFSCVMSETIRQRKEIEKPQPTKKKRNVVAVIFGVFLFFYQQ